ncbi:MAG: heparinase II/III family protein [Devosia sp.]
MNDPDSELHWPIAVPEHPRLLASEADWARLRSQVQSDAVSRLLFQTLSRRAERIVTEAPLTRDMTGRMLLMVARQALERVSLLALVANVTEDRRFVDRAAAEMRALAAFEDWNPSHFLDTAEMALALSIGYDWLYHRLDAATRQTIETALMEKAIRPSLDETIASNWWLRADENWVQVCHGGLAAAAIVLGDGQAEVARQILQRALDRLPAVARRYAPDGAYPEGPMYWSYGTAYQVVLAAALERFTGSSHGIERYAGFMESADYIAHVTAPSGAYFNYSDCAPGRRLQAQLFWLADRDHRPDWLADDRDGLARDLAEYEANPGVQYWYYDMVALALLWHRPTDAARKVPKKDLWVGGGPVPVALYRWGEGHFLGVKGGSVGISHSHMDLGSFVYEATGVRWAVDLGMQDYDSLERAGVDLWNEKEQVSQRWDVFRIGPDSHNILRFDDRSQLLDRLAPITVATARECVVDLSNVYDGVPIARRIFKIADGGFLLDDEWSGPVPVAASVSWLTYATVKQNGDELRLRRDGKELKLHVSSSGTFAVTVSDMSAPVRPFDAANPGLTKIEIRCQAASHGRLSIAVKV